MFDAICTFPLASDLFAQCIHPRSPLLALGLASGHVQLNRLPPSDGSEARNGSIESAWRTRRHKGSCRSLCFSHDGEYVFSAGTDGLVKVGTTETGQVVSKIAIPQHNSSTDPTSLLHALTPETLLLATDSSALHLYDLRASCQVSPSPSQTHHPHDDYISSLTPLSPTDASASGYSKQWASTGGTTVAVTDLRRGVLVKSEDQGEELLSSTTLNGKLVVGGEKGGLRLWEVGVWDDNEETIVVGKGASADVLAAVPDGRTAAIGMDDGVIRFVGMGGKRAKVVGEVRHDEIEGALGLGFDIGGRMISGGGSVVKIWEEGSDIQDRAEVEDDADVTAANGKRASGSGIGEDPSDDAEGESSEEEEKPQKKKKRKKNKGRAQNGVQHIMAFKSMD